MEVTMAGALNAALRDSMREDDSVVVYGEDVGRLGGVFRITDGLQAEMGADRCFDTPVAESGIVGTAIGMALYGHASGRRDAVRRILLPGAQPGDQPRREVPQSHARSRRACRSSFASRTAAASAQSSITPRAPRRTTRTPPVSPSSPPGHPPTRMPCSARPSPSTIRSIFLEPKRRYWLKEDLDFPVTAPPIGKAIVRRPGTTATVIAYGPMVTTALEAATRAADESGLDLEVIDVRTLSPLDIETLVTSATKTGRVVVVHEAARFVGYGAEIAAELNERAFGYLAAPVLRVSGWDVPYPSAKIERHFLPDADRILDAVARLLEY